MDLSYCRELIVLADRLNFTDAAELLYVTQSTLSKHVAAAEREVGFKIFERTTSSVGLTAAGSAFIDGLRQAVETYDRAVHAGRSYAPDVTTAIRVVGPLLNERLMGYVTTARVHMAAVGTPVRVTVTDTGVRDCLDALIDDRADVAIAFKYGRGERRVHLEHLMNVPFGIACHGSHALAAKPVLTFDDIVGCPLVSYPLEGRTGYHAYVQRVCRRYGIDYAPGGTEDGSWCFPNEDDQVVFGVHFAGYARFGGDIVARPLDDNRALFDVCAGRRTREADPLVLAFYEAVVQAAREA